MSEIRSVVSDARNPFFTRRRALGRYLKTTTLSPRAWSSTSAFTTAPSTKGRPIAACSSSATRRTRSSVMESPGWTSRRSTWISEPSSTRYCLPPDSMTAYMGIPWWSWTCERRVEAPTSHEKRPPRHPARRGMVSVRSPDRQMARPRHPRGPIGASEQASGPLAAGIVGRIMRRTLYEVLMVHQRADQDVITVVYRHLAKRFHPDIDPSPEAQSRMAELNEAYEILDDPVKRARY